jgi:aspartyl-tRNA(Asn)/glutamyl-tRNA(Gln) amidotransferase subunit A
LKPTFGSISTNGVVPLSWSLDHVGPIARTVEDVAILLEVLSDPGPGDRRTADPAEARYSSRLARDVRGIRVGVPSDAFGAGIDPVVAEAVQDALRRFETMGASLVEVSVPDTGTQNAAFATIVSVEAFAAHEECFSSRADEFGMDVRQRIDAGRAVSARDYAGATRVRENLTTRVAEVLETVDVLVMPTVPISAPSLEETRDRRDVFECAHTLHPPVQSDAHAGDFSTLWFHAGWAADRHANRRSDVR